MSIETKQGIFTDLTTSGSGFVTFEDGRQAFVSPSIVSRTGVQIGEEVECRLVPNYEDKRSDNVPWRTFFLMKQPTELKDELKNKLLRFFDQGGAWTIAEVYDELYDTPGDRKRYTDLCTTINTMTRQGYLAHCKIFGAGSSRSWRNYYSISREFLIPQGALEDEDV